MNHARLVRQPLLTALAAGVLLGACVGEVGQVDGTDDESNDKVIEREPAGASTPRAAVVTLTQGVPVTGLAGSRGAQLGFQIDVPAGSTQLTFRLSGGTGDADLYVRFGAPPTTGSYDGKSEGNRNEE